jgi:Zn-finger protein
LNAQKLEVEKRVRQDEFPKPALEYLDLHFEGKKCTRFFREYHADTTNYEAKFKWQKQRYSVEFLVNGTLKDIEKQVPFSALPTVGREKISAQWAKDFRKFKVVKCQEQTLPNRPEKRYEIEVKGKDADGMAFYEYLFEANGNLVKRQKIILPSNNITLY